MKQFIASAKRTRRDWLPVTIVMVATAIVLFVAARPMRLAALCASIVLGATVMVTAWIIIISDREEGIRQKERNETKEGANGEQGASETE